MMRCLTTIGYAITLAILFSASFTAAQEDGWTYEIGPHVWFAGVQGDIQAGGFDAKVDFSHANFSDADKPWEVGVAVHFKAWRQKRSFTLDISYLEELGSYGSVEENIPKMQFKQFLTDFIYGYSVKGAPMAVDVLFGLRTVILQPDIQYSDQTSTQGSRIWLNPFIGLGLRADLSPLWQIVARVEGGGLKSDSKTVGLWAGLDYHLNPSITFRAGYRRIDLDHTDNSDPEVFVYDVKTDGLVLGLSVAL
jgi:opacity protein-like surface antigen